MECRQILMDQIKEREEKLKIYQSILSGQSYTSLDPEKTKDPVLNKHVRIEPINSPVPTIPKIPNLDSLIQQRKIMLILDFPANIDFLAQHDEKEKTIDDIIYLQKIWPKAISNGSDSLKATWVDRDDLLDLMATTYLPSPGPLSTTEEFLQGRAPLQGCQPIHGDLKDLLEETTLKPSSQKIYRSEINSRLNESRSNEPRYPHQTLHSMMDDIGVFFEHLEKRCLNKNYKENPLRAYHDLLEMRLLLYVDAPSTYLDKVALEDIVQEQMHIGNVSLHVLHLDGQSYILPNSFVKLAQAVLSPEEPLMKKTIHERNRFVENIAKAAKIEGKITTKSIQIAFRQFRLNYPREGLPPQ